MINMFTVLLRRTFSTMQRRKEKCKYCHPCESRDLRKGKVVEASFVFDRILILFNIAVGSIISNL